VVLGRRATSDQRFAKARYRQRPSFTSEIPAKVSSATFANGALKPYSLSVADSLFALKYFKIWESTLFSSSDATHHFAKSNKPF
jgi:hypothetical protein